MSLLSFAKKIAGRQDKQSRQSRPSDQPAATPESAATDSTATPVISTTINSTGRLGLEPLITEDSVVMHGSVQTIAFRVRPEATKQAIGAAVHERFGVAATSIRTLRVRGKNRRRGQTMGLSNAWKKAYVTLPAGKTIDITV